MNNLGAREKYGFMLLGIVLLVFIIYFFGIRTAQMNYDNLTYQKEELRSTLAYYEQLKTQNADAENEISQINANISELEATLLPELNSEAIEQYVLDVFEQNGCPYLVSASVEDVGSESVKYPDGTIANDSLLVRRITVTYSTTDGFNVAQYNQTDFSVQSADAENIANNIMDERMVWQGMYGRLGYDEFIASIEQLETANPNCVKLNSVAVSEEGGYILMTATIDFYSSTFNNRVSTANTSAPYITFAGADVDTDGGFIGMPFVVDDSNSGWFSCAMTDTDATAGDRPFAAYFSAAVFRDAVETNGLSDALGIGNNNTVEVEAE